MFGFFSFIGQSHDLFLWQHDFENSSSLTAHCCRKLCRRQPTLGAWLIHCSLSSHSQFDQGFPAWISDGDDCVVGGGGVVKASNSMQRLVGGIHLILCVYYGVRPCTPPPLPAPAASIHNSVLSLFQGEYQLCTGRRGLVQTTQLICIHIRREPHEHPGLHFFCIKPGSPITETILDQPSLLWEDLTRTTADFFLFHFGLF